MPVHEIIRAVSCIGLPYVGGFLGAMLVPKDMEWYKSLKKPYLSPPPWVFGPAWSILYGCIGLASLYVLREADNGADVVLPLSVYGAHLILSWPWMGIYFGLKMFKTSIAVILGTTIGAGVSAYLFYPISPTAGYLMLPYVAWMCFASYLNISTAILNRDGKTTGGVEDKSKAK
ncbi:hypothetical protein Aperf_G00000122172 [Anoplocephala perfoliata]